MVEKEEEVVMGDMVEEVVEELVDLHMASSLKVMVEPPIMT
jgi:hypothetical protein